MKEKLKQTKGRRTRKEIALGWGKVGEINFRGCDNENISYTPSWR